MPPPCPRDTNWGCQIHCGLSINAGLGEGDPYLGFWPWMVSCNDDGQRRLEVLDARVATPEGEATDMTRRRAKLLQ